MRTTHILSTIVLTAGLGLLGACTAAIDYPSGNPSAQGAAGSSTGPTSTPATPSDPGANDPAELGKACIAGKTSAGPAPLRRLTRAEYDATVGALFAPGEALAATLEGDELIGPINSNTRAPISEAGVDKYAVAAKNVVARASSQLAACSASPDAACVPTFLRAVGEKIYRRPLTDAELARYSVMFDAAAKDRSFADGATLALRAMLQSPYFLYHVELGQAAADGIAALTSHELAARLSYLVWGGARDAELDATASAGSLSDPAVLEAQVRRMLAAPEAAASIRGFHTQLTGVAKLAAMPKANHLYPDWTPELAQELADEPGAFADAVIRAGDGTLTSLLTASFSVAGPLVGRLYGASGAGPRYELAATERAGLLTLPGLMAAHSSVDQSNPVKRAAWVREVMLCQELAPPPNNVVLELPKVEPNVTTRERFRQHRDNPTCAACHTLLDPVGLGFEHYDAIGRYRAMEAGAPVDASGEIVGEPASIAGPFNGAIELAQKLASSPEVQHCMGRQWFRYALGREPTGEDDCARAKSLERFASSGGNIRELIVGIATSDSFRFRKVEP